MQQPDTETSTHIAGPDTPERVQHRVQAVGASISTNSRIIPLITALLLLVIGGTCAAIVYLGVIAERSDLASHNPPQSGEQPRIEVLLRQRERNSDSHRTLSVFVAQDAIIYHAGVAVSEWKSIPSGSTLNIQPHVNAGFIISSRSLPNDLHWEGGHLRLIADRNNHPNVANGEDVEIGTEGDVFKALESLIVEARDGRSVFSINGRHYLGSLLIHWQNAQQLLAINQLGIESYLEGVLQAELNVTWPLEALKAQAVISRSYAYSKMLEGKRSIAGIPFDVRDSVADQDYQGTGNGGVKIDWAITSTRGQVLTHQSIPFAPYFHAASGGHLASIRTVFPNTRGSNGRTTLSSVMAGKEDPYYSQGVEALDKATSHGERTFRVSSGELRNLLRKNGGNVGWILRIAAEREPSGHITRVRLGWAGGEEVLSGAEFRTLVGPNRLRSTLWNIESPKQDEGTFVITSRGWGHGVGLSQVSMYAMTHIHGFQYPDVLHFFYDNSTIERLW